jgi:hypothetical protein
MIDDAPAGRERKKRLLRSDGCVEQKRFPLLALIA